MTATGIGLISGGLDSMLAAKILMEQKINVVGISFVTPFFSSTLAEAAARSIGFPLLVKDITDPHMEIVRDPPSGYGANMNPCIDCHALMVQVAGGIMEEKGWDFIFTGEVLNERPMSQNRRSLNRVVNLAGYRGRVLRPLSALLLPATDPEEEGKVDRSRLFDIQGRSRKRQFELARRFGIESYPSPAGGCLLTDPAFSRRLRDLIDRGPSEARRHVEMLRVGRHFRLRKEVKVIVGRNERENLLLARLTGDRDVTLEVEDLPGPVTILAGSDSEEDIRAAAALCVRYSDAKTGPVTVAWAGRGVSGTIPASPLDESLLEQLRI